MTRQNDRLEMLIGDLKSRYGESDAVVLAVQSAVTDERPRSLRHHLWPSQAKRQVRPMRYSRLTVPLSD